MTGHSKDSSWVGGPSTEEKTNHMTALSEFSNNAVLLRIRSVVLFTIYGRLYIVGLFTISPTIHFQPSSHSSCCSPLPWPPSTKTSGYFFKMYLSAWLTQLSDQSDSFSEKLTPLLQSELHSSSITHYSTTLLKFSAQYSSPPAISLSYKYFICWFLFCPH